jgi:hypothetical protein
VLYRKGIKAHARRKFIDTQRKRAKGKTGKADMALNYLHKQWPRLIA